MVMVLEQSMVSEMARIGELRRPNEACGVLLPYAVRGRQVIEIPNRSETPHDEVFMLGEDILLELEMIYADESVPQDLPQSLTFWHTHPGGNLGPSHFDLQNKGPDGKNLVITLGDQPKATWF